MSLENIKRVRVTDDVAAVNKGLNNGWQLLSVSEGKDGSGYPIQKFTLGSPLTEEQAEAVVIARASAEVAAKLETQG